MGAQPVAGQTPATSPAARLASRQAYRNQSRTDALATARAKFPWLVDAPALKWPAPDVEAQLKGYLNPDTAVVGAGPGRRGLLESSIPLRGKTTDGTDAPIDLSLIDAGGSAYAPRSAATAVRIPASAQGELRFPDRSFGVTLDSANNQPATISQNKAFFANALQDSDLVLEPRPQGAELSLVLRSPAAPSEIPLRFHLAAGQALKLADGTGADPLPPGSVELIDGGKPTAAIYPASASDADGKAVPVTYKLDGDRLLIEVDTSGDLNWPVLVDPPIGVYDNNGTSTGPGTAGYTWPNWAPATYLEPADSPTTNSWSYCNNQASNPSKQFYFCQGSTSGSAGAGGPLYIKPNAGQSFATGNWAQWVKQARVQDPATGTSYTYIYRLDAAALSNVGAHQAHLAVGVRTADGNNWEGGDALLSDNATVAPNNDLGTAVAAYKTPQNTALVGDTRYLRVHGPQATPSAPNPPITPGNRAVLRIVMEAGLPGTPLPYVSMGGAATYSSELYAPTLDLPKHTTPPDQTHWVAGYTDTVSTTAHDKGLGMGTIAMTDPSGQTTTLASDCPRTGGPTGTKNSYDACKLDLAMPGTTYTAPEGVNTYTIAATDLVGNHDAQQDQVWSVRVDHSGPSVSTSGPLSDQAGQTLPPGQYNLHVDAADGAINASPSAARSGLQSIEIRVDGDVEQTYSQPSCSATGCSGSTDYTFDTSDWPAEQHTIDVVATDQLGNQTTKTFTVGVAGDTPDLPTIETDVALPSEVPDTPPDPALVDTASNVLYADPAGVAAEQAAAVTDLAVDNPLDPVDTSSSSADAFSPPQAPATTQVVNGVNSPGLGPGSVSPSDSTGALGPQHYIEMVNQQVGVYTRALAQTSTQSLATFVGSPNAFLTDPQVLWDAETQRWYYTALRLGGSNFYLAFGWSKTADPSNLTSGWCKFFKNTGDQFEDYPKLGDDLKHIVIGTNLFIGQVFKTAHIWAVPKPLAGDTSCAKPKTYKWGSPTSVLQTRDGDQVVTPVPAQTGQTSSHVDYVAASDFPKFQPNKAGTQIQTWHVSGARNQPRLTKDANIAVSQYKIPADVHQPGSDRTIDLQDARLTQAVAMRDPAIGQLALWTQHTIRAPAGRSRVRWYELLPRADSPRRQQGNIEDAQQSVFNGAISPTVNGDAIIHYNVAGPTLLPELRARSRLGSTGLDRMTSEITLATSDGVPDHDFSCFDDMPTPGSHECRWGDYAAATPDQSTSNSAWGTNALLGADRGDQHAHWKTQNFQLLATP